jgi:hypothetical protein
MFLGSRARPERKPDNLIAIYELIVRTMWDLNISQTYGPPRPVTGTSLLLFPVWRCPQDPRKGREGALNHGRCEGMVSRVFFCAPLPHFLQLLYITKSTPNLAHFSLEDDGSTPLRNVALLLQDYMLESLPHFSPGGSGSLCIKFACIMQPLPNIV